MISSFRSRLAVIRSHLIPKILGQRKAFMVEELDIERRCVYVVVHRNSSLAYESYC